MRWPLGSCVRITANPWYWFPGTHLLRQSGWGSSSGVRWGGTDQPLVRSPSSTPLTVWSYPVWWVWTEYRRTSSCARTAAAIVRPRCSRPVILRSSECGVLTRCTSPISSAAGSSFSAATRAIDCSSVSCTSAASWSTAATCNCTSRCTKAGAARKASHSGPAPVSGGGPGGSSGVPAASVEAGSPAAPVRSPGLIQDSPSRRPPGPGTTSRAAPPVSRGCAGRRSGSELVLRPPPGAVSSRLRGSRPAPGSRRRSVPSPSAGTS